MAVNLKPKGPKKPKKKKAAKPGKPPAEVIQLDKSRTRKNTVTRAEAIAEFEEIFELHRELAASSGEVRKRIADAYATTAKKLDMPKKTVKHLFKLEKFRRENEAAEKEFDGRDREGFMVASQIFGEDTPFGQFALRAAERAKKDGFGGKKADDEESGSSEGED